MAAGERGAKGQETGNYVIIKSTLEDGSTVFFKYAHLDEINVEEGQELNEGDVFGKAGTTGNASGLPEDRQHVHIEASTTEKFYPGRGKGGTEADDRVDPLQYFDSKIGEDGKPVQESAPQNNSNPDKHQNVKGS